MWGLYRCLVYSFRLQRASACRGKPALDRFAAGYLSIIGVLTGHSWAALGMGLGCEVFTSMRPPGEQSDCGALLLAGPP